MDKVYHILNGDALKEQFQPLIAGVQIVARECLVDGPVVGGNLEELFQTRAQFLSRHYPPTTEQAYYEQTVSEFAKIQKIEEDAVINLWFEDDLFCQVNFWFVAYLLNQSEYQNEVYLVRPPQHTSYGFGGLNEAELTTAYDQKVPLAELATIGSLWAAYQKEDLSSLKQIALTLTDKFPFILEAVEAHIERIPGKDNLGRPSQALLAIMQELNTEAFGPVFKAFSQRESIYGFGDLQVKRLYDDLLGQSN
ncbi:MAG: DUF1835 domain-containing protein [Bacteroidota bacterium]